MNEVVQNQIEKIKPASKFGHASMIYVIGADQNGPIKIGKSSDVAQRVFSLQTGNPLPLMVFGMRLIMPRFLPGGKDFSWGRAARSSATRLEKRIHDDLKKMGLRMMGEWFDLAADEALAVVDKVATNISARSITLEWLSRHEAKTDPELGWLREKMLSTVLDANAQAAEVNKIGLTATEWCDNLLASEVIPQ